MKKFRIKYNYDTGDSLNQYNGLEEYIEIEFDDLDVAKKNLKRIESHYFQYQNYNSLFESNQNEDWFVKDIKNNKIDHHSAKYCIKLYTDENRVFQLFAPWCGNFERLNSVEIEGNLSDRKIIF